MIKQNLTFSIIQIVALLLSFFVLGFALVGSHGRLYFSNIGGAVALILTIILSVPLLYLFTQRHKLQNKKSLFFIATLLFSLAMIAIFIGLPNMTKQFLIDKNDINNVSIYDDNYLTIKLKFESEMFERVSIEANISKANNVELKKLDLTILNNKNKVLKPVFQPLAWDSLHFETIQMNKFFEINDYSKMNKFDLSAQYSIEHTDSLKIQIDYAFTKNGQVISNNKQFGVKIENQLMLEKLIK